MADGRFEMDRRTFLGLVGGAATAATVGGAVLLGSGEESLYSQPAGVPTPTADSPTPTPVSPGATAPPESTPAPAETGSPFGPPDGRTLVVVQMLGGNDALNTLVPMNDGRYYDARPSLGLAAEDLTALPGVPGYALNSVLDPLLPLWEADRVTALYGVGLPDQSRSHFVATDTWWSGQPGKPFESGWLGRWLDLTGGTAGDPMRAVALGAPAPGLTGSSSQATLVRSIESFDLLPPSGNLAAIDSFRALGSADVGGLLGEAQRAVPLATRSVATLLDLRVLPDGPDGVGSARAAETQSLFDTAASIIEADVGSRVVVVQVAGFDTHAAQRPQHDEQLASVANGISALFDRLAVSGADQRTLVMTFSEFGRRVAENGSGGTDHGNGGLALMVGPAVRQSTVIGSPDLGNLDDGDLRTDIDTRSVYTAALDWLGGGVEDVLGSRYDTLEVLSDQI